MSSVLIRAGEAETLRIAPEKILAGLVAGRMSRDGAALLLPGSHTETEAAADTRLAGLLTRRGVPAGGNDWLPPAGRADHG